MLIRDVNPLTNDHYEEMNIKWGCCKQKHVAPGRKWLILINSVFYANCFIRYTFLLHFTANEHRYGNNSMRFRCLRLLSIDGELIKAATNRWINGYLGSQTGLGSNGSLAWVKSQDYGRIRGYFRVYIWGRREGTHVTRKSCGQFQVADYQTLVFYKGQFESKALHMSCLGFYENACDRGVCLGRI